MKELQLLETKGTMTSLEIAEITGKEHKNILADVRDEISKLGTERGQLIFQPSYYKSWSHLWLEWAQRYNRKN